MRTRIKWPLETAPAKTDNWVVNNSPTILGTAYHRYNRGTEFGIRQSDRLFHMLVIGQTGTGKTTLLANMAKQDAEAKNGFCLIDPHGDLASALNKHIGREHIYWNAADPASTYGYNPLTRTSAGLRPIVASGLIDTLKQQWADAWGARMEHLLRHAILALLELPRADLRDIIPMFVEKPFRERVVAQLTDPQVIRFWRDEFKAMNYKTSMDGVAPIANKIGGFLAHPVIRKSLCEPDQPLRFRKLMDAGETVIVNLAKGRLGSDIANVLGGLLMSSVMHAAYSRYEMPELSRRPFALYVDEFPSFSTKVFTSMLSEARKYGLCCVLANQNVAQSDTELFHSIIGNVGTIIVFRIGALDAPLFARQLDSVSEHDLTNLPNYNAFIQLMIEGRKSKVFSCGTFRSFFE